jgi:hypothetical protein
MTLMGHIVQHRRDKILFIIKIRPQESLDRQLMNMPCPVRLPTTIQYVMDQYIAHDNFGLRYLHY